MSGSARKFAQQQAKALELELEQELERLARAGRMIGHKTPDPVKITSRGRGAQVSGRLTGRATLDFLGCMRGGRHVTFDAKFTTDRLLKLERLESRAASGLSQWDMLRSADQLGALAFVLARTYREGAHRPLDLLLPFPVLEAAAAAGRRSVDLHAAELAPYRRHPAEWLDAWITRVYDLA